jgi:surfactin synthase thioesterase subunit
MKTAEWIVRKPDSSERFRLYCFSYAGGSANSFTEWQKTILPSVSICAIQLPGRGGRFHEQPYSDLPTLVEAISEAIQSAGDVPFAFFGHSLGGLLAFEVSRYNARHGKPLPKHLFISGCHAARYRTESNKMHSLDDESLIERMKGYGGTPPEILAHRELMELLLPVIRADFALVENYTYKRQDLLSMPITVLAGTRDECDSVEQVSGWEKETTSDCNVKWFDGGHFFIRSHQQEVIDQINAELADITVDRRLEYV